MKQFICWILGHRVWTTKSEVGLDMPVSLFNLTDGKKIIAEIHFCTRCYTMYAEDPLIMKRP